MVSDQRKVWTAIADSFDATRQRPWPHVVRFIEALPPASRVLDLMCGNGRHAKVAAEAAHHVLALDWSAPLVRKAHGDRVVADAQHLPLRDGVVDACVFAAGLHGIATAEGRSACLRDLHRVLAPDGTAQVTVWSRHAPRFAAVGEPGAPIDVEVPWRAGGHDEVRGYHLYTPDALRADLEAAGFVVDELVALAVSGKEPDNLVALLHKN